MPSFIESHLEILTLSLLKKFPPFFFQIVFPNEWFIPYSKINYSKTIRKDCQFAVLRGYLNHLTETKSGCLWNTSVLSMFLGQSTSFWYALPAIFQIILDKVLNGSFETKRYHLIEQIVSKASNKLMKQAGVFNSLSMIHYFSYNFTNTAYNEMLTESEGIFNKVFSHPFAHFSRIIQTVDSVNR